MISLDSGLIRGIAILTITLAVIAWLPPFIGVATVIMTPLPFIHTFSLLGRGRAVVATAIAYGLVVGSLRVLAHPVPVVLLVMVGFAGVMLAEILRRRYSVEKTMLLASLALFLGGQALLQGVAWVGGVDPWGMVGRYVEAAIGENLRLYGQMNISPEQLQLIRDHQPQIVRFIIGIFPSLAWAGAIFSVWLNILAGRLLLGTHPGTWFAFGDLSLWKAPEKLVWLFIVAGGLVLLAPWDLPALIGMNLLIFCCLIYFFQGMAIVSCLFKRRQVPLILRWLFYVLIAIQQYMAILVIAVGLFDIWVDFRKRMGRIDSQA